VKDINQLVKEKDQRLLGDVLLVVSKLEIEKLLIVGFFELVLENFKGNLENIFHFLIPLQKTKF